MTVSELKDAEREGDDWVIHVVDHISKMADANGVAKVVVSCIMPVKVGHPQTRRNFLSTRKAMTPLEKMTKVYNIHLIFKYFRGHLIPCICPYLFPH